MYFTATRKDRIGMKIFAILYTINYCLQNNYIYIHTPLKKEYEQMFNFTKLYKSINDVSDDVLIKNFGGSCNLQTLFKKNQFPKFSNKLRNKLISLYDQTNKTNKTDKKCIRICIHCRRGDTCDYNSYTGRIKNSKFYRNTPDSFVNEAFEIINKLNIPVEINVYSDSKLNINNFNTYKLYVKWHFNEDIRCAINDMITCDILFRYGISAFSGICAFYNKNIIISKIHKDYKDIYNFDNLYTLKNCIKPIKNYINKYINN